MAYTPTKFVFTYAGPAADFFEIQVQEPNSTGPSLAGAQVGYPHPDVEQNGNTFKVNAVAFGLGPTIVPVGTDLTFRVRAQKAGFNPSPYATSPVFQFVETLDAPTNLGVE